jgi:2-dehydro-3-deoxy-L-rhamnonate dehydrogenase (NAD+)
VARNALVTGAASGIGAAVADRLLSAGVNVAGLDLHPGDDERIRWITGDVGRSEDVDAAVGELGVVDVLVCCAGISGASLRTTDVPDEEWHRVFAVNADGVFWCNRAVLPGMIERGWGRIVNVASIAGKDGNPMAAAYSASKAAVIALTKAIGKDVATTGVLVNCVAPAVIETPMLGDMSRQHVEYMVERIPMRRMGRPEEVAALVEWLAGDACSFSTGAVYDISGGRAVY